MVKNYSGTLFLITGNSSSGKDSIISRTLERFPDNLKKAFMVRRYITREPSEFEDNYCITEEKFKEMEQQGKFALKWHIYDLYYGVPIDIDNLLKDGHPVLVNVSRTVVEKARKCYANLKVVFIYVPLEITINRIKKRGRERLGLLKERVERAKSFQVFPEADFVVDNSGELKSAVDQFLHYIISVIAE